MGNRGFVGSGFVGSRLPTICPTPFQLVDVVAKVLISSLLLVGVLHADSGPCRSPPYYTY